MSAEERTAWFKGYSAGYEAGYDEGEEAGRSVGFMEGYVYIPVRKRDEGVEVE